MFLTTFENSSEISFKFLENVGNFQKTIVKSLESREIFKKSSESNQKCSELVNYDNFFKLVENRNFEKSVFFLTALLIGSITLILHEIMKNTTFFQCKWQILCYTTFIKYSCYLSVHLLEPWFFLHNLEKKHIKLPWLFQHRISFPTNLN